MRKHSARRISSGSESIKRRFSNTNTSMKLVQTEETFIESLITDKLSHGQVVMWTLGDKCQHTGKSTQKVKKMLTDNCIEYEEHNINEMD